MTRRDAWTPPVGTRFGRLVVEDVTLRVKGRRKFLCVCDCGGQLVVEPQSLKTANTRSCGCLRHEFAVSNGGGHVTHGLSYHPAYKAWTGFMARCYDPKHKSFVNYGGRGIGVHEPWRTSCESFVAWVDEHLGPRPEGYSLDRINNDRGYEPGNLRWADWITQSNNRRPAARTRWSHPRELE